MFADRRRRDAEFAAGGAQAAGPRDDREKAQIGRLDGLRQVRNPRSINNLRLKLD
jgi:hypothetical protein